MIVANLAAAEYTDHSANFYLPACRDFASMRSGGDHFLQGQCVGIIEGLTVMASDAAYFESSRSCVPDDATLIQMATVVVRWLDRHPEDWHKDFRSLTLFALHDA
jgi:hypothetical protein